MKTITSLFFVFSAASLCFPDINGMVTDTGTTPIANAIISLERNGQTVTTDADGKFTLEVPTATLSGTSTCHRSFFSVTIFGNFLNVAVPEYTCMEVSVFGLDSRLIERMRIQLIPGINSIELKSRYPGIHLYRLSVDDRDTVMKGCPVRKHVTVLNGNNTENVTESLRKKTATLATFEDIITATKEGYIHYRSLLKNPDTSGIVIRMIKSAGTVSDTDGNVYQTVQIGNQVWTTENLRTTKYNDGTPVPKESDKATWGEKTPKFCYYNNMSNPDSIRMFGALYNWYAIDPENPEQIAPEGWHVSTDADWDTLRNYLSANGYSWEGAIDNTEIAKSMATKTDWKENGNPGRIGCDLTRNNASGFSALPGGYRDFSGSFDYLGENGYWWTTTEYNTTYAWLNALWSGMFADINKNYTYKSFGYSVRLVKD